MQIETAELRKLCELLLSHVEELGHRQVEVPHDYYWNVPAGERYNPYVKPTELDLGQLTDNWAELQRFTSGADPLAYGLVWLSAVLRAVGETVPG